MKLSLVLILFSFFAVSCQTKAVNRVITPDVEKEFTKLPIPKDKPLISLPIGQNAYASFHHIQIKEAETPHIHKIHDLFVYVLSGESWIYLNNKKVILKAGDFVFIPKGTMHYAVNIGKNPTEVLATFTPPFDGKDVLLAEIK